jgi:hypothetical protein
VHRDAHILNSITVTHRFANLNDAQAFASSEYLITAIMNAGVRGQPEIWFTEDAESTLF